MSDGVHGLIPTDDIELEKLNRFYGALLATVTTFGHS